MQNTIVGEGGGIVAGKKMRFRGENGKEKRRQIT